MADIEYSNLSRTIPGTGKTWQNGRYVKAGVLAPADQTYESNAIRVIQGSAATLFAEAEATEGITLEKEGDDYFNVDSYHNGTLVRDPNKLTLWVDAKLDAEPAANGELDYITINIYVVPGAGQDRQKQRCSLYTRALVTFFLYMNWQELVYGWPANVADALKESYQPTVTLLKPINTTSDAAALSDETTGPVGRVTLKFSAKPKPNTQ